MSASAQLRPRRGWRSRPGPTTTGAMTRRRLPSPTAPAGGRTWNLISTGSGNGEGAGKLLVRDATGSGAVRMTVNTNGNVGIGTTGPNARLHVSGGDAAVGTQGFGVILKATDGSNC